jgi:hypothetical protein
MANRSDVAVRLVPLKFGLRHCHLSFVLHVRRQPG